MSVVDGNEQKVITHTRHETREVWQQLYLWAGTDEQRWRILVVMALLECADWNQEMVAMALRITQGRVSQIVADAKRALPQALDPSPRDLAGAA